MIGVAATVAAAAGAFVAALPAFGRGVRRGRRLCWLGVLRGVRGFGGGALAIRGLAPLIVGIALLRIAASAAGAPSAVGSADLAVVGRLGEVFDRLPLKGLAHELLEQVGRISGGGDAVSGEFRHDLGAAVFGRIPDGPHIEQLRCVPHEGGRKLIVCRTGFAGDLASQTFGDARRGTVGGGALHGLLHEMAVIGLEDLIVLLSGLVQLLGAVRGGDVVDDVERILHAIVCDGGMALGQIPHGDGVDAQDVVRGGLVDVFLDAGLMRDLGQLGRAEVLVDIHEHGVHRVGCGLVEIDVSPVVVQRVRHACGDSRLGFEDLSGIAVEYGVEVHALLRCAEQTERLHGGARFERGLGGVVELLGQIILAAIYGSDRTRLLLHRDAAYFDAFRHTVRTGVAHLLDLVLHGLVQRGDDLIAAGLKVLGGERLGIHQLVLDGGEQVAVRPRHLVVLLHLDDLRERSFLLLIRCDVAVLVHDADHALESPLGLRGVRVRIPYARSRNDAGEHGCLGKRQVLRILAVVRLGRRLNAVCIAAQVNGVHVVA